MTGAPGDIVCIGGTGAGANCWFEHFVTASAMIEAVTDRPRADAVVRRAGEPFLRELPARSLRDPS